MLWIAPSEKDTATDALEQRLWDSADQLRANSGLTSAQYSTPCCGARMDKLAAMQTELGRLVIRGMKIPVPPISLQKRFGARIRPTRTAGITLAKQCENLRRSRDLLLPRLLSGNVTLARAIS